jgi:large subunit ribosomal protein L23
MIDIIKRPIITEKAMKLASLRQYVFEVTRDSNKIQIKKALEDYFEVEIQSVRTCIIKGKKKVRMTRRGMQKGSTATIKKAYITLKPGFEIELVSGAGSSED